MTKQYISTLSVNGSSHSDDMYGYVSISYKDSSGNRRSEQLHIDLDATECGEIAKTVYAIVERRQKALAKTVGEAEFTPLLSGPVVDGMGNRLDGEGPAHCNLEDEAPF